MRTKFTNLVALRYILLHVVLERVLSENWKLAIVDSGKKLDGEPAGTMMLGEGSGGTCLPNFSIKYDKNVHTYSNTKKSNCAKLVINYC